MHLHHRKHKNKSFFKLSETLFADTNVQLENSFHVFIHCACIHGRRVKVFVILCIFLHRSHSFRCSSEESDGAMLSPVGLQHQNYTCNDVFPEPTDCHAAQCPIHQRYGRFTEWWSEGKEAACTKCHWKTNVQLVIYVQLSVMGKDIAYYNVWFVLLSSSFPWELK